MRPLDNPGDGEGEMNGITERSRPVVVYQPRPDRLFPGSVVLPSNAARPYRRIKKYSCGRSRVFLFSLIGDRFKAVVASIVRVFRGGGLER